MSAASPSPNTQSDQAFTSRQQLISFLQSVANGNAQDEAYLQDAMMYLGTFSRTLNQPSYWPDPNRPVEKSGGPAINSVLTNGNTEDTYNPPFRAARVTSAFLRNDGTTAVVNPPEPLVKKRFALSRLCWITYKGPSATNLPTSDPLYQQYLKDGVSPQLLSEGTAANIQAYFGLTWGTDPVHGGSCWTYNHGVTTGGSTVVGTLSEVQGQNRDPDFFELLQAAVKVGGISNPAVYPNGAYSAGYHQSHDTNIACQILQLGANIIDEANPTQYPTHIEFNNAGVTSSVYGAMDLPYLYAYKNVAFLTGTAANPTPSSSTPVSTPPSLVNPGTVAALVVPVIWNPYDMNGPSAYANSSLFPTKLRITAVSAPLVPAGASASNWTLTPTNSSSNANEPNGPYKTTWTSENQTALDFNNVSTLYREPTALDQLSAPGGLVGSGLAVESSNLITSSNASWSSGIPEEVSGSSGTPFVGFFLGTFPQCWTSGGQIYPADTINLNEPSQGITIRMEYSAGGNWIPYQEYYLDGDTVTIGVPLSESTYTLIGNGSSTDKNSSLWNNFNNGYWNARYLYDPRTSRWGSSSGIASFGGYACVLEFTDATGTTTETARPYATPGCCWLGLTGGSGWFYPNFPYGGVYAGWYNGLDIGTIEQNIGSSNAVVTFYTDSDGVVRRAMGGYTKFVSGTSASTLSGDGIADDNAGSTVGLPLAQANNQIGYDPSNNQGAGNATTQVPALPNQSQSRPIILHRPYRSVAELGYAFSDTPWRNIDFFTPESSYSALLDTFCINEDYRPDALAAGRVDLNTRQAPVIQALLAGAYRDEEASLSSLPAGAPTPAPAPLPSEIIPISQDLVTRTTVGGTNPASSNASLTSSGSSVTVTGPQPLSNIADLVGRWGSAASLSVNGNSAYDGSASYDGFSADLSNLYSTGTATTSPSSPSLGTGQASPYPSGSYNILQRFRETTMRALSDAGQAGTWNLMIDLVAQTGRYPTTAKGLSDFLVEGERHYWVHLAIDRQTGQVIDENIEPVNE